MITDRIGRHEVLLPRNHKNCNFREKKNSQVMKEWENLHKKLLRGGFKLESGNLAWPKLVFVSKTTHNFYSLFAIC